MGSATYHIGALGNTARTKLATNVLLGIQVVAYAELLGWLKSCLDIDPSAVLKAIAGHVAFGRRWPAIFQAPC